MPVMQQLNGDIVAPDMEARRTAPAIRRTMTTMHLLSPLLLAALGSAAATDPLNGYPVLPEIVPPSAYGGVPALCEGWPAPDSAFIETNYSNPDLPDLLTFLNGTKVTAPGTAWEARREEIGELLHKYIYGEDWWWWC